MQERKIIGKSFSILLKLFLIIYVYLKNTNKN